MPASVVLVHDDPEFRTTVIAALIGAGHTVTAFTDPLEALGGGVDLGLNVDVLITRIRFDDRRSNGVALARMVLAKKPGIKIIFVTKLENAQTLAEGLGEVVPHPVDLERLVERVRHLSVETSPSASQG
jgi:DNA-binding NtrC family response regulator